MSSSTQGGQTSLDTNPNRAGVITQGFFQHIGISRPCAKFRSREALSLFVEKLRKGGISLGRVMRANVRRKELLCTQVQRGAHWPSLPLWSKTWRHSLGEACKRKSFRWRLLSFHWMFLSIVSHMSVIEAPWKNKNVDMQLRSDRRTVVLLLIGLGQNVPMSVFQGGSISTFYRACLLTYLRLSSCCNFLCWEPVGSLSS